MDISNFLNFSVNFLEQLYMSKSNLKHSHINIEILNYFKLIMKKLLGFLLTLSMLIPTSNKKWSYQFPQLLCQHFRAVKSQLEAFIYK